MAEKQEYGAGNITVLEGLEAVRKRPGMYIGSVSRKGLNHLIYEIVDNSVDEHLAGFCDTIKVTLEKDGSCTVEDNGRGIPVGMHEKGVSAARLVFSTLHAGGKFDNDAYKTSGGLHGVGSSVVNALSVYLDLEVYIGGEIHHDRYERGKPVVELEKGLLPVVGKTRKKGTKINFLPDPEIFEKTHFKEEDVKSRLHETAYLNPHLTIVYEDKRREITEHVEFHEEEGIRGFVRDLNRKVEAVHDVVYFSGESEGITVEVAFQYINEFRENVLGFCNNIYNAEGGTHLTGFKAVFTTVINSYARELGILKEKDSNFTGADVRNGLTAVVSVKHPAPRFEGQTKTKLDNQDAARVTSKVTGEEIQLYFDRNLETLKKVISCAEKAAKIRRTEEKAKTNLLTKQKFSFDSNGKLANCESRDADVDGAHISTLLLTLFYRFMPELIFEGHVYIAMPPLYKAMPSRGEEEYLYDDVALEKYRKRHKGSFTLQRYKGLGEMDAEQLWETTLNPKTRMLKKVEIEDARMASDVTEMLMGTEVLPRREFIHEHAHDAELDI